MVKRGESCYECLYPSTQWKVLNRMKTLLSLLQRTSSLSLSLLHLLPIIVYSTKATPTGFDSAEYPNYLRPNRQRQIKGEIWIYSPASSLSTGLIISTWGNRLSCKLLSSLLLYVRRRSIIIYNMKTVYLVDVSGGRTTTTSACEVEVYWIMFFKINYHNIIHYSASDVGWCARCKQMLGLIYLANIRG